jgi:NAD+ synthase (glutamine-hydrolysing)
VSRIKVGAAILNQTPLDWANNLANIRAALSEARALGVSFLCLPELCLTGYGCEDAFHAPAVAETAMQLLFELLPETTGLAVALGLPLVHQNGIFNVAAMVCDGRLLGFVAKKYLAGDGLHYEPRWFKAWPAGVRALVDTPQGPVPLGDVGFEIGGVRVGFEICEDAWVAKRPGAELASHGIDLIFNPSASHFAFGKDDIRQRFVLEGSRAFSACYVYANLVGCESGRIIYDGGALIAAGGQLLATGPRLTFHAVHLTTAVVDLSLTRLAQRRSASFRPALGPDAEAYFVQAALTLPARPAAVSGGHALPWQQAPARKEEEFSRAVALGLFDYLRKSRARGFVLSLSGGADSTACAVLVYLMLHWALAELGAAEVAKRIGVREVWAGDARAWTQRLLTCVYQATRNSGPVTREAAAGVAEALGATYYELDVEPLVAGYTGMIEQALGRPFTWAGDDLALQNIQARVRAPSVWMLANVAGALLLTTSNRSEAAVGYATMDGDTAGSLSPVGGIDKAFLRHWLQWLETHGPCDVGPMPVLALVTRQAPTAELRPPDQGQTDEADLMPYAVLDAIERAAIRDKQMPMGVYEAVSAQFAAVYPPAAVAGWVVRFFTLWCRNQWKRERYAPSFHLDDQNLDPKTWCRFPILSGGFARELEQLQVALRGLEGGVV